MATLERLALYRNGDAGNAGAVYEWQRWKGWRCIKMATLEMLALSKNGDVGNAGVV